MRKPCRAYKTWVFDENLGIDKIHVLNVFPRGDLVSTSFWFTLLFVEPTFYTEHATFCRPKTWFRPAPYCHKY